MSKQGKRASNEKRNVEPSLLIFMFNSTIHIDIDLDSKNLLSGSGEWFLFVFCLAFFMLFADFDSFIHSSREEHFSCQNLFLREINIKSKPTYTVVINIDVSMQIIRKRKGEVKSLKRGEKKLRLRRVIDSIDSTLWNCKDIPSFAQIRQLIHDNEEWQNLVGMHYLLLDLVPIIRAYLNQKIQLTVFENEFPSIMHPGSAAFLFRWCQWFTGEPSIPLYELLTLVQTHFYPLQCKAVPKSRYSLVCSLNKKRSLSSLIRKSANPGDLFYFSFSGTNFFFQFQNVHLSVRGWPPYPPISH